MTEWDEFDNLIAHGGHRECRGPSEMGCACTGNCLGHHLALLRRKYDDLFIGPPQHNGIWWSDQGHCWLLKRNGDSGRDGAAITQVNYWTGAK